MSVVNEICSQYLDALNRADLKKVLSLFEDDAVVISPLYGEVPVADFYSSLFSDTQESKTRLLNILESTENHNIVALHFQFQWTLENGGYIDFECVDLFELSLNSNRFQKLTIVYDTYPIREDFNSLSH